MTLVADNSLVHERREQTVLFLLAAPALAVVIMLLVLPLGWLVWQSVYTDGFTVEHYQRIFTEEVYRDTLGLTFRISFTVTLIALGLGYPVAYVASVLPKSWAAIVLALVLLPFWTSVLVRAYAWLILLQRTGLVNSALMSWGLIESPLPLAHNELGTIIATVHILLPFMVLPLYATMQKIPPELLLAGASLGASPLRVFLRVFLPLSASGMFAGMTLVFILCLGFYITPELMGGGKTVMVSMLVSRNVELYNNWGAASAVSVVLLGCVFAIFYAVSRTIPLDRILSAK